MKEALRRCGHPEWVLTEKKLPRKEPVEPPIGRVSVPYVAKISEKVAKVFRRYNIQAAHRPVRTIKSIMFGSRKDKVEDLDKSGVVYHCECNKCNQNYIGETARCMRSRMYEHKVVSHKEAHTSHSINTGQPQVRSQIEPELRRSIRLRENGRAESSQVRRQQTEGYTPVSRHMASAEHRDGDIRITVVASDQSRWRRRLRESLAIQRINPTLNEDDGAYRLPAIYTTIAKFGAREMTSHSNH